MGLYIFRGTWPNRNLCLLSYIESESKDKSIKLWLNLGKKLDEKAQMHVYTFLHVAVCDSSELVPLFCVPHARLSRLPLQQLLCHPMKESSGCSVPTNSVNNCGKNVC